MSYRVEYGGEAKTRRQKRIGARLPVMTGVCFLLFVLLVTCLWPEGAELLREAVLPGDSAVVTASFERLKADLYSGNGVVDSMVTFCTALWQETGLAAG